MAVIVDAIKINLINTNFSNGWRLISAFPTKCKNRSPMLYIPLKNEYK